MNLLVWGKLDAAARWAREAGIPVSFDAERVSPGTEELVRLTEDGDRRFRTWSRGMRQRLKLGLALADESEVVLLDEPFLGVDPPNRRQLRDHIAALPLDDETGGPCE